VMTPPPTANRPVKQPREPSIIVVGSGRRLAP
jgi:hypothetical protein